MKTKLILMLLFATTLFASCTKELSQSYTLTNRTGMDGTVYVHECNDASETIKIQSAMIANGASKSFVASENTVKLKLYIDELDKWVQQVYYLEGDSTSIVIDGHTIVGRQEP